MPGGNATGPLGMGPMTGRGLGYCAGYAAPSFAAGRGLGLGFRRGFGWRSPYYYGTYPWFGRRWRIGGYIPYSTAYPYSNYSYPYSGYSYPYGYGTEPATDETTALKDTLKQISDALNEINRRISELESK